MSEKMQLVIDGDSIVFKQSNGFEFRLNLSDFPDLVKAHLAEVKPTANTKSTQACESLGAEVLGKDFKWEFLKPFIRDVCRWGGFALIYAKVLDEKRKPEERIPPRFLAAHNFMNESNQRIDLAIKEVVDIPGLGISFGSKHLRFLYPEFCPVLDVNTVKLGYEQTPRGYQKFAQDCRLIANTLTERGTPNPFPERPKKWFVSDIDMALFARLSGWK